MLYKGQDTHTRLELKITSARSISLLPSDAGRAFILRSSRKGLSMRDSNHYAISVSCLRARTKAPRNSSIWLEAAQAPPPAGFMNVCESVCDEHV